MMLNKDKKFIKDNKIIDERQQLQSLQNAKICFLSAILLLSLSIVIQSFLFTTEPMHYLPEIAIMFFICVLNIVLDVRQGNLYTSEMQNKKKNLAIYVFAALFTSLLTCGANFIKYDFPIQWMLITVPVMFVFLLALMLLADMLYRKSAEKRLKKLENSFLENEDDE